MRRRAVLLDLAHYRRLNELLTCAIYQGFLALQDRTYHDMLLTMHRTRFSILQGDDEQLMKTIHLANVACGFHAS